MVGSYLSPKFGINRLDGFKQMCKLCVLRTDDVDDKVLYPATCCNSVAF